MRFFTRSVLTAICIFCFAASAFAAELTGAELKALLSGKSVYLENTTSTGGAKAYRYAEDGTALFKTAKGPINHGKWTIKETGMH